ncbi:MAG: Prefoldin subunit alpha [Candidatus Methanogasteraceae archaeon]|nr:MAG: Prefoldin subunit alpha [ANME-2 cluster archaeon]
MNVLNRAKNRGQKMSKELTEEELQGLLAQHDEYKAQAEVLAGQMDAIQMSILECERATNTIDALETEDEVMSLVPIGAGSFVHAKLVPSDRTIVGLGSGVSAEMSADAARTCLNDRKEKLTKILEQMNKTLNEIAGRVQMIQAEASKHMQARQADQAYM